jgi:tRNA pseudouridine13 synthase
MIKIKTQPEDFVVEEILGTPPKENGPYTCCASSSPYNTIDAVQEIAARLRKCPADISYGGRKDKHACASQFITIKGPVASIDVKSQRFRVELAGYLDRPMGPDLIAANRFRIVVRNVNAGEKESITPRLQRISEVGFFNYFDDQRFGPFDPLQGFLAEKIIRKHFNGAVKFYLTHRTSEDKREDVRRKTFLFDHWGEWTLCLNEAAGRTEQTWLSHLSEHPKDFLGLLRKIPADDLAFHFASFQAFLWNEVLRRLICEKTKSISRYPGLAGEYLFAEDEAQTKITGVIPTISSKMPVLDPAVADEYRRLLQEKNIKISDFNLTKIRQVILKARIGLCGLYRKT